MNNSISLEQELASHTNEFLVADGLCILFSAEYNRYERKLSDAEKLSVAFSLTNLSNPFVWLSSAREPIAAVALSTALDVIERQATAEINDPLPSYDTHPDAIHLSAIFDELVKRRDVVMKRAQHQMAPDTLRMLSAA